MFLQKAQHLDVGERGKYSAQPHHTIPFNTVGRCRLVRTCHPALLVHQSRRLKIPIDGALQRGATTYRPLHRSPPGPFTAFG